MVPNADERLRIVSELPGRLRADIARQGAVAPAITLSVVDVLDRSGERMGKLNVVGRRGPQEQSRLRLERPLDDLQPITRSRARRQLRYL